MVIVVANFSNLFLHLWEFFFLQAIVGIEEVGDVEVFVEFDDWNNCFAGKISAHHHYVNFGILGYGENFQKVGVCAMEVCGEENLCLSQAGPSWKLSVNQS